MTYANLDRVKRKLELILPAFKDRIDKDATIERLMGVAQEKIRFIIVQQSSSDMPVFGELAAAAVAAASMAYTTAGFPPGRRIRLLVTEYTGPTDSTAMKATITGTVAGITRTETILLNKNQEFVSNNAWDVPDGNLVVTDIPGSGEKIQIIQGIDTALADAADLLAACLFLTEQVDRFTRDEQPPEFESWCARAKAMIKAWVKENVGSDRLHAPLVLRAKS